MGTYILDARSFVVRDDKNVRTIYRRGEKVELNEEQEQRLRAGQPGSAFLKESDAKEEELIEIAVANEASVVAEDGSLPITPSPPRKVRDVPLAPRGDREPEPSDKARAAGPVAKPVTSTKKTPSTPVSTPKEPGDANNEGTPKS